MTGVRGKRDMLDNMICQFLFLLCNTLYVVCCFLFLCNECLMWLRVAAGDVIKTSEGEESGNLSYRLDRLMVMRA